MCSTRLAVCSLSCLTLVSSNEAANHGVPNTPLISTPHFPSLCLSPSLSLPYLFLTHSFLSPSLTFYYSPAVFLEAYITSDSQSCPIVSYTCHTKRTGDIKCVTVRNITVDNLREEGREEEEEEGGGRRREEGGRGERGGRGRGGRKRRRGGRERRKENDKK